MHARRFVAKMLAVVLVLGLLAACAPAAAPTGAPAELTKPPVTAATAAPAEAKTPAAKKYPPIVVAIWSGPEHDNLVKTAAEYEKATGNKVTIEEIARESYHDKLTAVFLAGSGDYDVAYVSADWTPEWVKAETLMPFDTFISDKAVASPTLNLDLLRPGVDSLTFDGKVYGYPSEGDTAWLFYRKDLFEAKGLAVPQTWDEFLAAAQALNNPPDLYGALIGAKPDEAAWDFMHYFYAFGGQVVDKNWKVTVNNEAGVRALTFYSELLTKYKVVPPDVATYGYNEILTALQEGKVAMGIEWMAATQDLQDCSKSPKVCKDGQPQLEYTLVPGLKGADGKVSRGQGASQWGWVIPKATKNAEAAYKFVEWLTSHDGAKIWALNGGIPSNTEALADPDVVAKVPQFKLLAEAMPYRHLFPNTTVTTDMWNAFNDAINQTVAGAKTPQQALDEAAAKMTEALAKGGYTK